MIVKDEARLISACLERARGVVAQMVVVDTGSTDGTPELARAAGAEVYHHPWEGSFSKARNLSLLYAREPWALILDGDELLDEGSVEALCALELGEGAPEAYELTIVNFSTDDADERAASLLWQVRLFRVAVGGYGGAVHNQVMNRVEGRPLVSARAPARVLHYGYTPSVWAAQKKDARLSLLERAVREEGSPFTYYNLANHLKILGRHREALEAFMTSLPSGPLTEEWMPIASCSASFCASREGLYEVAAAVAEVALRERPGLLDALARWGEALGALRRHSEVVGPLARALESPRREALKLRALFFDAPYVLARSLFVVGDTSEALLVFLSLAAGARDITVYTHLCLCAIGAGEGEIFGWARARGAALDPLDPDWAVVDARAALLEVTVPRRLASQLPLALAPLVGVEVGEGEGPAGALGVSAAEQVGALLGSWSEALVRARAVLGDRLGLAVWERVGGQGGDQGGEVAVEVRLEVSEVGGRLVGPVGVGARAARLPLVGEEEGALVLVMCAALAVEGAVRRALSVGSSLDVSIT